MAAIGKNGKWEHLLYSMHYRKVGDRLSPGKVENDLQRASTEHGKTTGKSCCVFLCSVFLSYSVSRYFSTQT